MKKLSTGYVPRNWQLVLHLAQERHKICVFHRRGGKTVCAVNEIIDQSLIFNKKCPLTGEMLLNPHYAFLATTVGQAKRIAWDYFKQYMAHLPGVKFNESELKITYPHPRGKCTIWLFGTENYDALLGLYLDGYVLDEFARMHPDVRDRVLLPTISDRLGWEMIISTVNGANMFKTLYDNACTDPKWYSCLHSVDETGLIDPEELADLRKTMTDEAYRQEYLCDWSASPAGYYFQQYMDEALADGRIASVPYEKRMPVTTWWDLGFSDSGAIWFIQEVGREVHVIDYVENHGKGLEYYYEQLQSRPYVYSNHNLPHDADHHEISSGNTRREFLENLGLTNIIVHPKSKNVAEDIHNVRMVLNKCYFDEEKCTIGVKALRNYERKYDAKEKVYSDKPLHNWASHGADAFRGFATAYAPGFGQGYAERISNLPTSSEVDYDLFG